MAKPSASLSHKVSTSLFSQLCSTLTTKAARIPACVMTGYFMPHQPDNYHDQSSLELIADDNDHDARREREELRAESIRAQQQDADDTEIQ